MPTRQTNSTLPPGLLAALGASLAVALAGGCGAATSAAGVNPNAIASPPVVWVGIDQRPLAVGTQLTLTFQLPAGKTSTSEALSVDSSDPNIVAITSIDLAHNRMLVQALSPGQAVIELQGKDVSSKLAVSAAKAETIKFYDVNYLAAATLAPDLLVELPRKGFGLLLGGQEVVGSVLLDSGNDPLNSRGLAQGEGKGALRVTKEEPEMFLLSPLPSSGASVGTFCGGLSGPCSDVAYPVTLLDAIAKVVVVTATASDQSLIAVAQAEDANGNAIFGVNDWEFQLNTTSDARFTRLSPAAVRVIPPTSGSGPVILTATALSEGMSGVASLF